VKARAAGAIAALLVIVAPLIALAQGATPATPPPASGAGIRLPQGPGVGLVYANCRTCHDLQYVRDAKGLLPAQWKAVLASMHDYGLTIGKEDEAKVLDYLTTYLGPNPPPSSAGPAAVADGKQVYEENCAACHGAEGRGKPGYFPPLANNPDLARDPLFPGQVVLHGLTGAIEVNGQKYDGTMPPFDHLSDAEVAAAVNYVRATFGHASGGSKVDAPAVAHARARAASPQDVHAARPR